MKKKGSTIALFLIFLVGLGIFSYPTIADRWNYYHASRAIMSYTEAVAKISAEEYERLFAAAEDYNRRLTERGKITHLTEEEEAEYNSLLNIENNGIMGYIEIPVIQISLPIYHTATEAILQVAIGHLEWTSLPIGGLSTHAALSGHRGLPSAELFTNLDRLVEGDQFRIYVLNEILTYEVDQIRIVLPEEVDDLRITPGEDYITLVTCTPYGINTHRLLVRAHRTQPYFDRGEVHPSADAILIDPLMVAPFIAIPLLFLIFFAMFISDGREGDKKLENENNRSRDRRQ